MFYFLGRKVPHCGVAGPPPGRGVVAGREVGKNNNFKLVRFVDKQISHGLYSCSHLDLKHRAASSNSYTDAGNTKVGSIDCTVDLLFDWFGLVCFANKKNCQLSYCWYQTSQTGGQWYSNTSPFSIIPWLMFPHISILIAYCIGL